MMYEESETEEQEEVTKIYRKSRRKHRRRRQESEEQTVPRSTTVLSDFIQGPKPRIVPKAGPKEHDSQKNIHSQELYEGDNGRIYLKPGTLRLGFFLGECPYDDEEFAILKTKRIWKLEKTGRRGLDRFRRTVEFVNFARQIVRSENSSTLSHQDTILFFLDTQSQLEEDVTSGHLFDVTPFRSIGQKSFINSVRCVLAIPPQQRSEHEVNSMMHLLRGFSKFSNYPQHIQQGLCRNGWYAKFEKAKILAREGHRAEFYYFILAGVAVSRCLDTCIESEDRRKQVAEFHRQGDTLGENEILTNSERPATVVCKESVEVLGVDRETLVEIFNAAGGPECLDFLKGVPDLQDFPLSLLQTSHFSCSVHKYRRGAVIVKNSNESEWIYVIKTGSCQVYKAISAHPKKKSRDPSRLDNLQRQASELTLPNIHVKENLRSASSSNINGKSKMNSNSGTSLRKSARPRKPLILPSITHVKNAMVSMVTPEVSPRNQTSSKSSERRKSKVQSAVTGPVVSTDGQSQFFARLDIITERECFGLQSLLYKDMPGLSLVSNGAECVLISKQFLRDKLDKDLKRRLQNKVPPYPDLAHLHRALEDKLAWDSYKDSVLQESLK